MLKFKREIVVVVEKEHRLVIEPTIHSQNAEAVGFGPELGLPIVHRKICAQCYYLLCQPIGV